MVSSSGSLSVQQTLELVSLCLEKARGAKDSELALELCDGAETALSGIKGSQRKALMASKKDEDQALSERFATSYINLGTLQGSLGRSDKTHANFKKAVQWGGNIEQLSPISDVKSEKPAGGKEDAQAKARATGDIALISQDIFAENVNPPGVVFTPPQADERLKDIRQLAACLNLLQLSHSPDDVLGPVAHDWLQAVKNDADEQERLKLLATEVIRGFVGDEIKDSKAVAEVMCLAPVIDEQSFRFLLLQFYSGVDHSDLLNINHLQGLADLIHGADPGYLNSDDLVKILELFSTRVRETHGQSPSYIYQLTLAISHVLDAMADTKVTGLNREKLHTPLGSYLDKLRGSSDPYLVYQAAYAYQALQFVPDDETPWQAAMRRTGKVIQGVSGLVSAVKGLDLNGLMEGLESIQQGVAGASAVFTMAKTAYKDAMSLAEGGKDFVDSLKESFTFDQKRAWYPALRGMDTLIRDGHLVKFKTLVSEAPCRRDLAFQWGVCQRLGEIAANPLWRVDTRRDAVSFLVELYRNDTEWGQQVDVKKWILTILIQLSSLSGSVAQYAAKVLEELRTDGDAGKQAMYQSQRESGPGSYTLRIEMEFTENSPLLDRAQNKPDVEGSLRQLKKRRLEDQKNIIYIPPQAKESLKAPDDEHFPLMEAVLAFLNSDQYQVLLLLGDSGAGKSTFNKALECELWNSYKKGGPIPLHISLPSIDKPDQDMIAKQLRAFDFTDAQIKELKDHREFILICDGYDECQQTRNLYTSNQLNQPDEWKARMVISCRTEYIGADYKDRFQPGDRNQRSKSALLQEAVITPFSAKQVEDYIDQYVAVYQPLWKAQEYKDALDSIPSLRELVANPFLMTLLLDVLPRMMDPGRLSTTRITRVVIYDQFIEQWLERGKRRLGEKDLSPNARSAFESLSEEGFTINGIDFLKKLSVAIYKEQDGQPVVEYSRFQDEGSWKAAFFGRTDDQYLLREACPLTRNGKQYRFIHRSMLEYGVARAIFDPQEWKQKATPQPGSNRRGSTSSAFSFEIFDVDEAVVSDTDQEPDPNSPLVWRSFVNEASLLQFLVERVQQEPVFKKQLLNYVEHSKKDKKWRTAAANAITVLARAGVQFIGADLRGIRIPGADLSYGVFDSVDLQEADMRKVNFQGVWLRQTDLAGTDMTKAQFGELPYLNLTFNVWSCAFSPDGMSLAVGSESGNINVYSTSNWEMTQTFEGHENEVRLAYSPDGTMLVSGSSDMTVRIWIMESGTCERVMADHTDEIRGVAYSPRGNQVASACNDNTARLWDPSTGNCLHVLSDHEDTVNCIAYSPKGDLIVTGSADFTVRLWDVATGKCNHIFNGHTEDIIGIAFSPQGDQIASASDDTTLRLWDLESSSCRHILEGHGDGATGVTYSPKGDQLFSGSLDGTLRIWDVQSGACRHTLTGHTTSVACVAVSPKGNMIASGSMDNTVRLWDMSAGGSRHTSNGHSLCVYDIKCSPKGNLIATCSGDYTVRLWDVETGTCVRTFIGHTWTATCVAFSTRDQIASGSADLSVRLWDVEAGTCQHVLNGAGGRVYSVTYSPEGDQVASVYHDKTVRLWNTKTGELSGSLNGHTLGVLGVAYSPDGSLLATGSEDRSIKLWDLETMACIKTFTGHTYWVQDVAFSLGGNQLASAGKDKIVGLWSVKTGDYRPLKGHTMGVTRLAYSNKGDILASGSRDKTVRLWDTGSGQCRGVIQNFPGNVFGVAWVPSTDENYLVTGCEDGSVLKWHVTEKEGQYHATLCWSVTKGSLTVTGASIKDARGLTLLSKQLLNQRGVVGEPENQLR
ncbi:MAG: WD40-repeat-containing domain protein [Benniella sp.]|nr:MAG: WD40-repeat-containing domain protein [Benniella sp.]